MPAEFVKGDRVVGTPEYVKQFRGPWTRRKTTSGVVTSRQRGNFVNVRIDGNKSSSRFHVDFWQRADREEPRQ